MYNSNENILCFKRNCFHIRCSYDAQPILFGYSNKFYYYYLNKLKLNLFININ